MGIEVNIIIENIIKPKIKTIVKINSNLLALFSHASFMLFSHSVSILFIIEIPQDCDILYIGISKWGVTNENIGSKDYLFLKNINENIIQIYNMLSTHGMLITSLRGMLTLQKCILEDFFKNRHYDISISQIQPYLNVYAVKKPLVYQYKKIGGCELGTKFELTNKQDKHIPEELKNRTNISIQTLATI